MPPAPVDLPSTTCNPRYSHPFVVLLDPSPHGAGLVFAWRRMHDQSPCDEWAFLLRGVLPAVIMLCQMVVGRPQGLPVVAALLVVSPWRVLPAVAVFSSLLVRVPAELFLLSPPRPVAAPASWWLVASGGPPPHTCVPEMYSWPRTWLVARSMS